MNSLIVLLLIFLQIVLGLSFLRIVLKDSTFPLLESIPYAFGIGVGITAFILFSFSILGIRWDSFTMLVVITIGILPFIFSIKRLIAEGNVTFLNLTIIQKTFLTLNLVTILYVFIQVLLRPLYAWDGWAVWLIKSKMFYIDGFLNPNIYHTLKDSYPFVMSINSTFYYLFLGGIDDKSVLISYFVFYFLTGLLLFNMLKKRIGLSYALVATFLFFSLQNEIRHGGRYEAGYSDLTLGFYFLLAVGVFIKIRKKLTKSNIFLFGIILGITSLIKQEGLVISLVELSLFIFYLLKEKIKIKNFLLVLPGFIPIFAWFIYKKNEFNFILTL